MPTTSTTTPGTVLGVPTGLLLFGLGAAGLLAWINSGQGPAADPASGAATGSTTLPPTTGGTTGSGSSSTPRPPTPAATPARPARRPVVKAASPLLYVFVDSILGEGLFDRLRETSGPFDGNGLNRIVTLNNKEFAGWATGSRWVAKDTSVAYLQLYTEIGGMGYNYWIQESETKRVHAQVAQTGYGWLDNTPMSSASQQSITLFYARNYA